MAVTLVTGASGLIGAHFMSLSHRHEVIPVRHSEINLLAEGVMADLVQRLQPSTVVHLAWVASGSPGYRDSDDNALWLDRSVDLLAACRESGAHLVLTGTVSDDGTAADAYSRSKAALRGIAHEAASQQPLTFVRPHYVFDPSRERPRLVADSLAAERAGVQVELADPYARHDFIHAVDVASALLLVTQGQLLGEVDVGSGAVHEVRELVEALEVPWVSSRRGPSMSRSSPPADIAPLARLGWKPRHTFHFFGRPRRTDDE